jgi:outer membrane protein TolC
MNRTRSWYLLLAILLGSCNGSPRYLTEDDWRRGRETTCLTPQDLEPTHPAPVIPDLTSPAPATVLDPGEHRRWLSLAECVALALENGRIDNGPIRTFALDPAIAAADIERSLSKFDAQWQTSMLWQTTDTPVATAETQSLLGQGPMPLNFNEQTATFNSTLVKPLPTGGVAGITFNVPYQFVNTFTPINPSYSPFMQLSFEQPLLRGYGVEINELRDQHPGGILQPLPYPGPGVDGILLTRVTFDRSRAEFVRRVQDLILEVERAYWTLYLSYWTYYSAEQGMRQTLAQWQRAKAQFDAGQFTIQDLTQLDEQYQSFRAQRLVALGQGAGTPGVLEAERLLRLITGLPLEDGSRLVPADKPTEDAYLPDWQSALQEALTLRPELIAARDDIRAAQLALIRDKDDLRPDLRFLSNYNVNSAAGRLDEAFAGLSANQFHSWTVGLQYGFVLGYRDANGRVRQDKLRLSQNAYRLHDQENLVVSGLGQSYRRVLQGQEEIRIQQARLAAATANLEARNTEFLKGAGTFPFLLESQRNWAFAVAAEKAAVVSYNIALAQFQRDKGTILIYDNVTVVEGPLPRCAQLRASAHIRERQDALELGERALPAPPPPLAAPQQTGSLPDLLHGQDVLAPLPAALPSAETLPPPRLDQATPAPEEHSEK